MATEMTPGRFIPFRKADVVEMCLARGEMEDAQPEEFRKFCHLLECIFHFEFHRQLEALKNTYSPFNPDADTRNIRERTPEERERHQRQLVEQLYEVLEAGNYERVEKVELDEALEKESLFRVQLHVEFSDFADMLLFRRGENVTQETLRTWFGLRKQRIDVDVFERVVIFVRFHDQEYFDAQGRTDLLFRPGSTLLKMFRDVPKYDIEMLYPNTEVRMKRIDKLVMGVPAAVGGVAMLVMKLGAPLVLVAGLVAYWIGFVEQDPGQIDQKHLIAIGGGLFALGGFLFRQWTKFKTRKIKFMKALTDNLYFRNLDNNLGVIFRLIDNAEEEECKEAMIAYYFCLSSPGAYTERELDEAVERWFADRWDCVLDFEVADALDKLRRLGIVEEDPAGKLSVPDLAEAKRRLDEQWDNYFDYNHAG